MFDWPFCELEDKLLLLLAEVELLFMLVDDELLFSLADVELLLLLLFGFDDELFRFASEFVSRLEPSSTTKSIGNLPFKQFI